MGWKRPKIIKQNQWHIKMRRINPWLRQNVWAEELEGLEVFPRPGLFWEHPHPRQVQDHLLVSWTTSMHQREVSHIQEQRGWIKYPWLCRSRRGNHKVKIIETRKGKQDYLLGFTRVEQNGAEYKKSMVLEFPYRFFQSPAATWTTTPDVNLTRKEGKSTNGRISGVSRMLVERPLPKATDPYCAAITRKALWSFKDNRVECICILCGWSKMLLLE